MNEGSLFVQFPKEEKKREGAFLSIGDSRADGAWNKNPVMLEGRLTDYLISNSTSALPHIARRMPSPWLPKRVKEVGRLHMNQGMATE